MVVSELNLDRDVGVQLFSRSLLNDKLGYTLGLFGGEGRNRLGREAGFLYSARVELWPFGQFDDVPEGDLQRRHRLSYYMRDHNLKIQGDYSNVTDQTSARRVHQVRAQFQLFF